MERNNEILNELENISPLVAAIGKANVFSVPEGYFESISNTVMLSINEEHLAGFIPELPEEMNVPAGYFDALPNRILAKIKQQETGELPAIFSTIKKDQPFKIPDNYFETLADAVLNRIKNQQAGNEEVLPAVLHNLKTVQPFTVPGNYFDELPANILKRIKQQTEAKVITMPKRFSVLSYAAAAVITGALALGVYKYSNQPSVNNPGQSVAITMDPSIEKGTKMDDQKFNEVLNNLTGDEIENYLQQNSSETDIATLSSNVEETVLPNEEDYLLDDNTLDKFLKDIESKTN